MHVIDFALAVVVRAFAQSGAAKIEAQHRPSKSMQRLGRMENNFVVQRAAEERVGMAHHCGVRRGTAADIEQGFEASSCTFERERFDLRFVDTYDVIHFRSFSRSAARALFWRPWV